MDKRGAALGAMLVGIVLAVAGGALLNYTSGAGVAHHTEWATSKGLPPPAYWMFVTGVALLLFGGIVIGASLRASPRSAAT
jgi:hypothetical protein